MIRSPSILPGYIGHFRVISELGRGPQGVDYLAADTRHQRQVSLHSFQFDQLKPDLKHQLLKEANYLGRLQHPNIVALFEANEHQGHPYLVYEHVDGVSLKSHLSQHGKLSIEYALELIIPIINAIAYAHKRQQVHHLLSSENIILTANLKKPRIKGFGLACMLSSVEGLKQQQQLISDKVAKPLSSTSCDIMALGQLLYEMLTAQSLANQRFVNQGLENNKDKISNIDRQRIQNLSWPEQFDDELKRIISCCLQLGPEQQCPKQHYLDQHYAGQQYHDVMDLRRDVLAYQQLLLSDQSLSADASRPADTSTLQFLLHRMKYKKDFPTLSHKIVELAKKTQSENDYSANALSNTILKDFSLSTKLLRLVNSSLYGHYGGKISTVSRAVVILGFDEVRNVALGLMLLEHLNNKKHAEELKQATICSVFSACIASALANKLSFASAEEAYICAMFRPLGYLLCVYYFADEMSVIKEMVSLNNMSEDQAAESVLGVTYAELGIAVAESWKLPKKIIHCMSPLAEETLKKPGKPLDVLLQISGLANQLSDLIMATPSVELSQRLKPLYDRYSKLIPLDETETKILVSQAITELHKYSSLVNLQLEKNPLFQRATSWLGDEQLDQLANGLKEHKNGTTNPDATRYKVNQEQIIHAIEDVTNANLEVRPMNDILVMVMEAIYRGFGFQRVIFCMPNTVRNSLDARFGFGKDMDRMIPGLHIPLENDDIFHIAYHKHQDILIEDVTDPANSSLLPAWYLDKYAMKSLLLYPVVLNNKTIGVLYIDSQQPVSIQDEYPLELLKTLRNQIILAIRQSH